MQIQKGLGMYGVLLTINDNIDLQNETFTSQQAAELTNLSIQAARNCLTRLVNLGVLIMEEERNPKNFNCRVVRYRLNINEIIRKLLLD